MTNRARRAHFVVTMDRSEGGFSKRVFGFAARDNKIALFDGWGDLVYSNSTRSVGNAVKDRLPAGARHLPPVGYGKTPTLTAALHFAGPAVSTDANNRYHTQVV